jgi:hypothetical protein
MATGVSSLGQAGINLFSTIARSTEVATKTTDRAVEVAGQAANAAMNITSTAVNTTGKIGVSGLKATGKLGTSAFNVAGNTGNKAIRTTGAITNKGLNATKRVANATLNTTAVVAESTAAAAQQGSKEILKQAGNITESATFLVGSATTTVTDMFGRLARGLGEGSRTEISKMAARNKLRGSTSQHFKDALIAEYQTILASTVKQFTSLFQQYNTSFKEFVRMYKNMNCARGYLWGHRCSNPTIKANIKGFKDRVGFIGANFTASLSNVKTSVMRYSVNINGLNKGSDEELMTEAKALTEANFSQFTALINKTTEAFDTLFEDMSRPAEESSNQRNKMNTVAKVADVADVADVAAEVAEVAALGGRRRTHKKKRGIRRHRTNTHRR